MRHILITLGYTFGFFLLVATVIHTVSFDSISSVANVLTGTRSNPIDKYRTCTEAFITGSQNFDIKTTQINTDSTDDAFLIYTDDAHCGSGGCLSEICVSSAKGTYEHIKFEYAFNSIKVLDTITNDMHDIELNGKKELQMNWNGSKYELTKN